MKSQKNLDLNQMEIRLNKSFNLFKKWYSILINKSNINKEISQIIYIDDIDYARLIVWEIACQLVEYIKQNIKICIHEKYPKLLTIRNFLSHQDPLVKIKEILDQDPEESIFSYLQKVINELR